MLKLVEMENGKVRTEEVFQSFEALKKHLIENDYFGWILDEEPDAELPDFTGVTELNEVVDIFQEFDYSWWTMDILEEYDPVFFEDCGDYYLKVFHFEDDTHYLQVEYHENVRLRNKILYLTEKDFERLQSIFKGFDDMEADEQSGTIRYFEDTFHI